MAQECAWTKGRIELHTVIVHYSSAALTKQNKTKKQLKRDECKRIREDNRSTHKSKQKLKYQGRHFYARLGRRAVTVSETYYRSFSEILYGLCVLTKIWPHQFNVPRAHNTAVSNI